MEGNRRVYYSFYDIPRDDNSDIRHIQDAYVSKPPLTSKTEIIHLTIAMFILSVAFSFALGSNGLFNGLKSILDAINAFPMAVFSILTGFFFHEMSHKFVAQRYGLWAQFRMYPRGLLVALLFGIVFGFVIAAPGAVTIQGGARKFEIGRTATAGPLANIIIASITLPTYLYLGVDSQIGAILGFVCLINIFLGLFNLFPFDPLDGKKIITWNAFVWAIITIWALIIFIMVFDRMYIPGWF